LGITLWVGCGAAPKTLGHQVARASLDEASQAKYNQLIADGDAAWLERLDEAKLRAAIASWEQAVKLKADDHATYAKLARGTYLLADGFLWFNKEDDDSHEEKYLTTHENGVAFAEQGLRALSAEFEKLRQKDEKVEDAVKVLDKTAVPLMYWYATNLGKWANTKGLTTKLKHKDRIFSLVKRVLDLDPDFFYGAPDRYFGAYYAVAPGFAGGDMGKSKEHFEKSLAKAPNYLGTHVLLADLWAAKEQNREVFDKELKLVLAAPVDSIPELIPEQTIEKRKAEKLLKGADDRF
jgi:tetratricopeptide (TPR) repeat protein